MAKFVPLKPQNRTTWDSKVIPSNSEELIARITYKNKVQNDEDSEDEVDLSSDDTAIINTTGLKEIAAITAFDGTIIHSYVVTPSGILYEFKVDVTNDDFDFEWWTFAFKNYKLVVANTNIKKNLAEFVGLENKDVKATVLVKGKKADDNHNLSLEDIFNIAYPPIA